MGEIGEYSGFVNFLAGNPLFLHPHNLGSWDNVSLFEITIQQFWFSDNQQSIIIIIIIIIHLFQFGFTRIVYKINYNMTN